MQDTQELQWPDFHTESGMLVAQPTSSSTIDRRHSLRLFIIISLHFIDFFVGLRAALQCANAAYL